MTYKVIGPTKTRAFRVLWMLEELGLPYEHVPAMPQSEEVRSVNASGKVPALVEGDTILTDSMAILTYLADKHGRFTAPAGTIERARQDAVTFWLIDEFDAILWTATKHSFILPEDQRVPAVKETLKAEFAASAARLSARLDGPFLMGDEFTIADILACHCLGWAVVAKFPRIDDKLADYARNLRERPAYQAAAAR